ncbi:MAG: DUF1080 domain-containing protein [Acidobacteriota bacterium]
MIRRLAVVLLFTLCFFTASSQAQRADRVTGRWNMTVTTADGTSYPSWFEITREGDKLAGRFVGRTGSQRPLKSVEFRDNKLTLTLPIQYEQRSTDLIFTGRFVGRNLEGETRDAEGKPMKWVARRAPALARRAAPQWMKPITLFNGKDLAGWRLRDPKSTAAWKVVNGELTNDPHSTDIITTRTFRDFKLHIEFRMEEKSNSGVYARGRYEVQVQDDFGKEPDSRHCGGIYGFIAPTKNPVKKAGEWQSFDITLIGRRITVTLNGETIIDNVEIPGITGGALDSDEAAPGPVMLQGDHGKIYYRNIVLTPAR